MVVGWLYDGHMMVIGHDDCHTKNFCSRAGSTKTNKQNCLCTGHLDHRHWYDIHIRMFGPDPMNTVCPNCHNNITTATTEEIGVMAWVAAGVLCAFVCWPCAPIPLCMDSLKDVTHRCPSCHCIVGRYRAKLWGDWTCIEGLFTGFCRHFCNTFVSLNT